MFAQQTSCNVCWLHTLPLLGVANLKVFQCTKFSVTNHGPCTVMSLCSDGSEMFLTF